MVLFPNTLLPIHIFEERYKKMIGSCLSNRSNFGVVLIRSGREVEDPAEPHSVGCEAEIVSSEKLEDGRMNIVVRGARRFRILRLDHSEPFLQCELRWLSDEFENPDNLQDLAQELRKLFKEYVEYLRLFGHYQFVEESPESATPEALSFSVAGMLQLELSQKQELVEISSTRERLQKEISMLLFFRKT